MLYRKLTRTDKGECILRIPKWIIAKLKLKGKYLMIHNRGKYLILEDASARLAKMAAGRRLDTKRPVSKVKAT